MANPKTKILSADEGLTLLGIPLEAVQESVKAGQIARSHLAQFYPPVAKGIHRWGTAVAVLHYLLKKVGWRIKYECNLPLAISPNGTIAVMLATGDAETGELSEGAHPNFKHPRGSAARMVMRKAQLSFSYMPIVKQPDLVVILFRTTRDAIYVEVSMPRSLTPEGWVEEWAWRSPFPVIDIKKKKKAVATRKSSAMNQGIDNSAKVDQDPPRRVTLARKKTKTT